MELEELKKSYKKSEVRYSPEELKSIFEIRTKGALKNINRKMLIDALLMVLMTIVLITITFFIGLRSKYVISGQIASFGLLLFLHYRIKYYLLNNLDFEKNDIRGAIKKMYKTFYLYWFGYQIVIPIVTMLLFADVYQYIPLLKTFNPCIIYLIIGLIGLVITTILLKMIYGKEYNKLHELNSTINNQIENY